MPTVLSAVEQRWFPPLLPPPTIARTVLEDICDKPIRIQFYCAVARLHGV
jgi:hypothetical protein